MTGDDQHPAQVFENRFADAAGPAGRSRDVCRCVDRSISGPVTFHAERQDTESAGWRRLLALIDEAAADRREVFKPLAEMSAAERREVVTLPATIGRLTDVRHLVLYGSNLVRIPPEIGAMTSLEIFEPYTSHRLHWYPYEVTRCARLRRSTVSTRALYGNDKFRPPFPSLPPVTTMDGTPLDPGVHGTSAVRSCSVCGAPADRELHQVWISRAVATDVLPLLVNACSAACVAALPQPHPGYVATPHTGGPEVTQPDAR